MGGRSGENYAKQTTMHTQVGVVSGHALQPHSSEPMAKIGVCQHINALYNTILHRLPGYQLSINMISTATFNPHNFQVLHMSPKTCMELVLNGLLTFSCETNDNNDRASSKMQLISRRPWQPHHQHRRLPPAQRFQRWPRCQSPSYR